MHSFLRRYELGGNGGSSCDTQQPEQHLCLIFFHFLFETFPNVIITKGAHALTLNGHDASDPVLACFVYIVSVSTILNCAMCGFVGVGECYFDQITSMVPMETTTRSTGTTD